MVEYRVDSSQLSTKRLNVILRRYFEGVFLHITFEIRGAARFYGRT